MSRDGGSHQTCFPLLPEPIRVTFDVDRTGVMKEPVEDRARDDRIAEDIAPRPEALIAGQQDRAALVTVTDELEEEIRALPINRDVADLVGRGGG
jgi:hypothetical protein